MGSKRSAAGVLAGTLFLGANAPFARAETIELVTYYPTAANTGDLHVRSLTVGDGYRNVTPGDGEALLFDALGIGLPAGTVDPAGLLEVAGLNDTASPVIPGNIVLQWARRASSSAVISVLRGSYVRARRVA